MKGPKRVFFATIAAGGGHVTTALAFAEGLAAHYPGEFETRVSDVMAEFGADRLDRRHKAGWRAMLRRPRLVHLGQRLIDAAPALTRLSQRALLDGFARDVARRLDELAPDLVVANHGWLATAFAEARARHGLKVPVVVFTTEAFDASALWAEPRSELVLTPSLASKEDLVRLGVPKERVRVVGYPVRQAFLRAKGQAEARAALGLEEGFTTLLSLGAEGIAGEAVAVAERILGAGSRLVAVAGRNESLRARLDSLALSREGVTVFGFTERMPELLAAADLVVGKAGPASTTEALAVGRPVLVTASAGPQDDAFIAFLEAHDLGGMVSLAGLPGAVAAWKDAPGRRQAARERAARMDFAGMTARGCAALRAAALGEPSPVALDESVAGRPFEGTTGAQLRGRRRAS